MITVNTAVVLAGGQGTRLRSMVSDRPKPMALVNGKPFLERLLDYWHAQGIKRFVLAVGYMHEIIIEYFSGINTGYSLDYLIEKEPLGTGGGLIASLRLLGKENNFLLFNGDTFLGVQLDQLLKNMTAADADMCMALIPVIQKGRYSAVSCDEDTGRVTGFGEVEGGASQLKFSNGGVYLLNKQIFNDRPYRKGIHLSFERDLLPEFLTNGVPIVSLKSGDTFVDIGVPKDYVFAQTLRELGA